MNRQRYDQEKLDLNDPAKPAWLSPPIPMKKLVEVIEDALIERGWTKLPDVKPNRIGEVFEWVKDGSNPRTMMEAMEIQDVLDSR